MLLLETKEIQENRRTDTGSYSSYLGSWVPAPSRRNKRRNSEVTANMRDACFVKTSKNLHIFTLFHFRSHLQSCVVRYLGWSQIKSGSLLIHVPNLRRRNNNVVLMVNDAKEQRGEKEHSVDSDAWPNVVPSILIVVERVSYTSHLFLTDSSFNTNASLPFGSCSLKDKANSLV